MTIADLVRAASAGEQQAWDALVDRFAPTVWAIARGHRLSPVDAAYVSHITWEKLAKNLHRIQRPGRIGAWLATTARRESLLRLRPEPGRSPDGKGVDQVPVPPQDSVPGPLITDLVSEFPTRPQILLRLLGVNAPLSYRDISEALDMPIGSIGPTRARALDQLRRKAAQAGVRPEDILV